MFQELKTENSDSEIWLGGEYECIVSQSASRTDADSKSDSWLSLIQIRESSDRTKVQSRIFDQKPRTVLDYNNYDNCIHSIDEVESDESYDESFDFSEDYDLEAYAAYADLFDDSS